MRSLARTLLISGLHRVAATASCSTSGSTRSSWGSKLPFEVNRGFSTYGNPDLLGGFLIFPLVDLDRDGPVRDGRGSGARSTGSRSSSRSLAWITAFVARRVDRRRGRARRARGRAVAGQAQARCRRLELRSALTAVASAPCPSRSACAPTTRSSTCGPACKSIIEFGEGSALTRFEIWQAAIDSIKARPIFGWGADTFRLVFPKFKPLEYTRDAGYLSVADNVHNYPLAARLGYRHHRLPRCSTGSSAGPCGSDCLRRSAAARASSGSS